MSCELCDIELPPFHFNCSRCDIPICHNCSHTQSILCSFCVQASSLEATFETCHECDNDAVISDCCQCGTKIIACQDHLHRCEVCDENTCANCDNLCLFHGHPCGRCGKRFEMTNMASCDYCDKKLCLTNDKCQIATIGNINLCSSHQLICATGCIIACTSGCKCGQHCKSKVFYIPYFKCQHYSKCEKFTCESLLHQLTDWYQKSTNLSNLPPDFMRCHKHSHTCMLCSAKYPMQRSGAKYLKLYYEGKNITICSFCLTNITYAIRTIGVLCIRNKIPVVYLDMKKTLVRWIMAQTIKDNFPDHDSRIKLLDCYKYPEV